MNGQVELDFHVLRRLESPSVERTTISNDVWLDAQLHAFIERYSADRLYDNLVDERGAWCRPRDLVGYIRNLIEAGWVEVVERSLAGNLRSRTPDVQQGAVELRDLISVEPPDTVEHEPTDEGTTHCDPATAAQISTLIQAARVGVPFCEICTNPPPAKPANAGADPVAAARIATLLAAAESGAAFCEVCT